MYKSRLSTRVRKIVLVAGANWGLGYAIVSVAAKRDPSAQFILACRNAGDGDEAVKQLKKDDVNASLEVLQLDVTDDRQILEAVETVPKVHGRLDDQSLPALRAAYTEMLDVNLSSLACVSAGFEPLLAKASRPKVINITSRLASIANCLTRKLPRSPPYCSSKTAVNGMTAQLQSIENDRCAQEESEGTERGASKIDYYVAAPGFFKMAFTRFNQRGKDPVLGAEVVVQLIMATLIPAAHNGSLTTASCNRFRGRSWRPSEAHTCAFRRREVPLLELRYNQPTCRVQELMRASYQNLSAY